MDDKSAILNFLGSTHGMLNQLDKQIVSPSSTLQRKSDGIKQAIEQVLKVPVPMNASAGTYVPPPNAIPPPAPTNQPIAAPYITQIDHPEVQPQDDQLQFDFSQRDKIYDLMDMIISRLDTVIVLLKEKNTQPIKKTRKTHIEKQNSKPIISEVKRRDL